MAEFLSRTKALRGVARRAGVPGFLKVQALRVRHVLVVLHEAVGFVLPGEQIVDGDIVMRHLPRKPGDETSQAGAGRIGKAQMRIGALTEAEVMLTTRPKPRSIMPSITSWIMATGV